MTPKGKRIKKCPSCGMEISYGEKACPQCGRNLAKSGKKPGKSSEKSQKSTKVKCPSCGAMIPKRSKRCPSCELELPTATSKAKTQRVKKTDSEFKTEVVEHEPLEEIDEGKKSRCPICASTLEGTESKCPNCGIPLGEVSQKAEPIAPIDSKLVEKPTKTVSETEGGDTMPCPVCLSIIPKRLEKCPVCNVSLVETLAQAGVVGPEAELTEVRRPEEPIVPKGEAGTQAARHTRKLKQRSEKVTAVPATVPIEVAGRTNGFGQVNGLGKVNGKGVVNGNAFVNGTGISNGVGVRSKVTSVKRTSMLVRWQFLAVLLAVLVIIPTFVFLSYSNKANKFSVDGDYADWDGATTYGTQIQSTAPSSNITEWAVGTQSSNLFFYFRTETNMMSSPNAEGYFLFVDSDNSNRTGYIMESIGADYILQLAGWDSQVRSSALLQYSSSSDQYNWNAWTAIGSLSCSLAGEQLEAGAEMPEAIGQSAKFVLVSKDSLNRGSVSYTAPSKGGLLIVQQAPSAEVAATGIVSSSVSSALLTLRFICEGEGGKVSQVNPVVVGAPLANQEPTFSLEKGEAKEMTIAVDTSAATNGQLISAEVLASSVVSTFANVQVIGSGASAYVNAPPSAVAIDGAFADWTGRLSVDHDPVPIASPGVDIDEVGNLSASLTSFFYVSVQGKICSGTFVPAMVGKPSGGGGGAVVPTRHTAEDILSIYVDSDRSSSTGYAVALDSKMIGADQKIEVKGLFGKITSMKEFDCSSSSGTWAEKAGGVRAAKDDKRIEISVSVASLGGSQDIDFIVETTSWEGRKDLAVFDPASMKALTRTWIVDPATTSDSATSLSSQRKIFYDGMNYWSFYFDGADTVYKYSSDSGIAWSSPNRAFATSGVNKVSVWYDSAGSTVYAVGDVGIATRAVAVQRGVVDPAMRTIAWSPTDSILVVSLNNQANKNTFISKDAKGYLWILSSNNTGIIPTRHDLSTFTSSAVDSVTSWVFKGNLIGAGNNLPNCNGNILPAGTGNDMYAIYAYGGNVASRKYTISWSAENIIHAVGVGNQGNTDNAPPSAVVDSKGVVHVVYGTSRKAGTSSAPTIEYSHNVTDQTTFTKGLDLDPSLPSKAGDYYPTISLETSTRNLYVLWLQSDSTLVPKTVIARTCVSGTWSEMTIQDQTIFTKQYLTSAYTVSDISELCWQWTQNTTAPIQVLFDSFLIPEFSDLTPPVMLSIVMFAVYRIGLRREDME